jgi:hypothetical protein
MGGNVPRGSESDADLGAKLQVDPLFLDQPGAQVGRLAERAPLRLDLLIAEPVARRDMTGHAARIVVVSQEALKGPALPRTRIRGRERHAATARQTLHARHRDLVDALRNTAVVIQRGDELLGHHHVRATSRTFHRRHVGHAHEIDIGVLTAADARDRHVPIGLQLP